MIIWTGLGFLAALVPAACLCLVQFTINVALKDDHYYQNNGWPKLAGFLLAALILWPLGNYLNRKRGRVLIDQETGEKVSLHPGHTLFFLPIQYWSLVFIALGIRFLFVKE